MGLWGEDNDDGARWLDECGFGYRYGEEIH